jgi:hypothetical protein
MRFCRTALLLVAVVCVVGFPARGFAQAPSAGAGLAADLQKDWASLKDTMTKLGAAMPAEKFSYKPKPELRTFAEQLLHVANANVNFIKAIDAKAPAPTIDAKATGQDEVPKALAESFDYGTTILKGQTDATLTKSVEGAPRFLGPSTAARLVYRAMGHTWDEYGVMTVYLRMNDITPPASAR